MHTCLFILRLEIKMAATIDTTAKMACFLVTNTRIKSIGAKLLAFICFIAYATHAVSSGAFYQQVSLDEGDIGAHETITSIFTKEFHKCSLEEGCNFVASNTKNNRFYRVAKKEDLQKVGTKLILWEKVKSNAELEKKIPKSEKVYKSCKEAMEKGIHESGLIHISVNGSTIRVFCDMVTDGGGWTVLQKRINSSVSFQRNWTEYENGFGDLQGNFWLGLKALHSLTSEGVSTLRFDVQDFNGYQGYAKYTKVSIGNVQEKYKISFDEYSGDIGDGMLQVKGMAFTTVDHDNDLSDDSNCADQYKGGWWYENCYSCNLNNLYPDPSTSYPYPANAVFMSWFTWNSVHASIKFSEIKIRNENQV